jgi:SAM-dependent methyltransferase
MRPKRILEIGTGTGVQSIFLSYFIKNLIALDNDRDVIRNSAQANIKHFRRKIDLLLVDAFSLPFKDKSLDICYSQGFLEHFRNDEIVRLVNEQLRVSKLLIHSIPSDKYPIRQFGNERHLSLDVWYDILANCHKHTEVEVKYGYFPLINWYIMIRMTA